MKFSRYDLATAGAVVLMLGAAAAIFLYAPTDALQGPVQRIFYLHVSSAIAAYACFAVVLIGGLVYLRNESAAADRSRDHSSPSGLAGPLARWRGARPDAVPLNEPCRRDVAQIARGTGYHLRFSTVTVAGEPLAYTPRGP